ncbi:sodium:proton antiporter [Aestuariirhabdus sp. Z084]|uniref:cation:proton antiporter n=1 Tax=Aestuariirhabdus haliotis TaxID=2918751 RepID=UPI00201B3B46|nr:sodium:proton antiporter [Aestuariirhabdus haliotis]MCL6416616.1 sodium:proton antiporter [Aestuariirhabdus haliotis]MCL6420651.1 sodium:proton antiporter [Aestuariirhabdus haliotis]
MEMNSLSLLAMIGVLSLACQWLAWRIRVPAILPLLVCGLLIGPGLAILDPDLVFGELLFPMVSMAVAIILFEGALTLDLREIRGHGSMVRNLISVGMVVTWAIIAIAAHWIMALSWPLACLFAALVVVTGPTVIVPLLRAARPSAKLANILRWEGILIDPVGALLAVLVYEFIVASQEVAIQHAAQAFIMTLVIGFVLGWGAARLTEKAMLGNWMPHYLRNPAMLCFMLGIYALSNQLQHESGLLTVTVMGMILANRHHLDMESIHEFKETLSVLLISALFILLAARLDVEQVMGLGWSVLVLLCVILFVARPATVWLSAIGTDLKWREKLLLAWISPRGIVAAAISGLFALKLEQEGWQEAEVLVPMVFMVIIATVVLQSLTAGLLTGWLGLKEKASEGFLIFGANNAAREIATALQKNGVQVRLADTSWENLRLARMENLPTYYGNPVSEHAANHLNLDGLGRVLILSPYQQQNPLVAMHFQNWFAKDKVFALSAAKGEESDKRLSRRANHNCPLLGDRLTYTQLRSAIANGAQIKNTTLSKAFTFEKYQEKFAQQVNLLFALNPEGRCYVWHESLSDEVGDGWKLIALLSEHGVEKKGP